MTILEAGCGSGWFCPKLLEYGRLTATDLSDELLSRAEKRLPAVNFVAGDFMSLEFSEASFDVVVTLEVLSHMADQKAFVRKLARYLRPGALLMLATQNRQVLQNYNNIPPPKPGQLRRWVDSDELRNLLAPEFDLRELFTASPKANKGMMRLVNSYKLNWPIRAVFGEKLERFKESLGLGWTLMALAVKNDAQMLTTKRV